MKEGVGSSVEETTTYTFDELGRMTANGVGATASVALLVLCCGCVGRPANPAQDGGAEQACSIGDLRGESCATLGFSCGELGCTAEGEFDTRSCTPATFNATTAVVPGMEVNGVSTYPTIRGDGEIVLFASTASNVVPGDTNGTWDVFLRDPAMQRTTRVSVAFDGSQAEGSSWWPTVSADGRFVAFESSATNVVPDDTNNVADVFVRDLAVGTTTRVSVMSDGKEAARFDGPLLPALAAGGRYVAFTGDALVPGDTNDATDIFVHDLATGATERVSIAFDGSEPDGASFAASISADGRFVAFSSSATNLVAGASAGGIYLRDRALGTTTAVSVAWDDGRVVGCGGLPWISSDGALVVFSCGSPDLVPGDTNDVVDVFVRDVAGGVTLRLSLASDGSQANGPSYGWTISPDGGTVAFSSWATNLDGRGLGGLFLAQVGSPLLTRLNVSSDGALDDCPPTTTLPDGFVALSTDGLRAAFNSCGSTIVPGDQNSAEDVFLRDVAAGTTIRVSVADPSLGVTPPQPDGHSSHPLTAGNRVFFLSKATNLVAGDGNGRADLFAVDLAGAQAQRLDVDLDVSVGGFAGLDAVSADGRVVAWTKWLYTKAGSRYEVLVHRLDDGQRMRVNVASNGGDGDGSAKWASLSGDGRLVAFQSDSTNLVPGDANDGWDIFVRDLESGETSLASVDCDGTQIGIAGYSGSAISGDGAYLAFASSSGGSGCAGTGSGGEPRVFIRDLGAGQTSLASLDSDGQRIEQPSRNPVLGRDGSHVAFVACENGIFWPFEPVCDLWIRDVVT